MSGRLEAGRPTQRKPEFDEIQELLYLYRETPSQQFSNRIALKFMPFIRRTVRQELFERWGKADIEGYDDAVSESYLVAVKAVQDSIAHPNPVAYVITCIQGMFKNFLIRKLGRYRNFSYLIDLTEVTQLRLALHYKAPELDDTHEIILRAIASLPDEQRRVAELTFVAGYSEREAAAKLGCSCVQYHKRLAKKRLISLLLLEDIGFNWDKLPTIKERAIQLRRDGVERRAIRERLGLKVSTLGGILSRGNPSSVPRGKGR